MAEKVWNQQVGWTDGAGYPFGFEATVHADGSAELAFHVRKEAEDGETFEDKRIELVLTSKQLRDLTQLASNTRIIAMEHATIAKEVNAQAEKKRSDDALAEAKSRGN